MSDDTMVDRMEAGRRVADEWAVLPGGEEKDEEMGDNGGVSGGAPNDGGGGGASSPGPQTFEDMTHLGNQHYSGRLFEKWGAKPNGNCLIYSVNGNNDHEEMIKTRVGVAAYLERNRSHYEGVFGGSYKKEHANISTPGISVGHGFLQYYVDWSGDKIIAYIAVQDSYRVHTFTPSSNFFCANPSGIERYVAYDHNHWDALRPIESPTDDDGGGGVASPAAKRGVIYAAKKILKHDIPELGLYPLHHACEKGASINMIKSLVEADGNKGKEVLGRVDRYGKYPLQHACEKGAPLEVIKYLVEADGDKGKEVLGKAEWYGKYPLHCACKSGASLEVIKYLVEEADGDKGKEVLGKGDNIFKGNAIHFACQGGASLDVIKYLVEEADGDKGKELLGKADNFGRYPLHWACYTRGASIDVIKYLIQKNPGPLQIEDINGLTALDCIMDNNALKKLLNKADDDGMYLLHWALEGGASLDVIKYLGDGDKGTDLLGKTDNGGMYPLHLACRGATLKVIKYLIRKNPGPLQCKDNGGLTALDYMDNDTLRAIFPQTHQIGSVADKSSVIDRLNYLPYAGALAFAARQAEQPGTSLCVGLYGRWGGGKSTLWKQIKKCLKAEFLQEDAQLLYDVYQLSGESFHPFSENAKIPFINAVKRLASDPYVLNDAKKAWTEKSEELPTAPLTFLEHLACMFLCIFCACQSCGKGYELDDDEMNGNDVQTIQRIQIKFQYARSRRTETNAFFFLVFLVSLSPIWILYWPIYLTCCRDRETNNYNNKKEAKQIVGVITGDVPLGDGDAANWDVAPCGRFFVIIILQIVRAIVSGISRACAALHHIVCFQWCCGKTNHTPTGAVKYKIVEFNAWTYQGSELLWASLMKELWDAVEAEFGKKAVRYHRAGIALAGENPYDESHCTLSPQQKAQNRKRALLMFRARSYLYLFLFLIVLTVLLTLTIMNCEVVAANGINGTCLVKVVNVTNNATKNATAETVNGTNNAADVVGLLVNTVEAGGYEEGVLAAIIATVAAFCPLLANVITYCKKVLPYLRKTRGDFILEKASGSTKRKDFKEELGFMGEVKTEVQYLFDLLATETYHDKEIGCDRSLRLCVFIDDLDRCPQESVVSVLEAVILLLVDGPISVWMAIDSRIVVQCIEAVKDGVFDKANISGHEFLDKIVQLPFALPELTNDAKESYLDKIIDEKELDPARVLSRFMKEGLHEKLEIAKKKGPSFPLTQISQLDETRHDMSQLDRKVVIRENKDPFFQLTQIATELDNRGHIVPRHDRKAVIGMTESKLIKIVAENPQNASLEHQENLCFIISQATSQLILEFDSEGISRLFQAEGSSHTVPNNPHFEKSDEQNTPGTDSKGSSHTVPDPVYSDASDDINHIIGPPPSGLYVPMLNEDDRRCLKAFKLFIDGNPRGMKRIINSFNVSRRIADLRCEASPQLTAKLLKMVILLEQWPYRMAWLLQLIEDVNQMSTHSVEDSRMIRFLEECFGRKVRPDESCWDMICSVGILELYRRVVCELSMSNVDSSNMETIDSDPQLFEGLLRCNGHDEQSTSEGSYAITVLDLRPLGCNTEGREYETCLRSYMFNMPQGITDKVSIMMNKALINYVGKDSSNGFLACNLL